MEESSPPSHQEEAAAAINRIGEPIMSSPQSLDYIPSNTRTTQIDIPTG